MTKLIWLTPLLILFFSCDSAHLLTVATAQEETPTPTATPTATPTPDSVPIKLQAVDVLVTMQTASMIATMCIVDGNAEPACLKSAWECAQKIDMKTDRAVAEVLKCVKVGRSAGVE